MACAKVQVLAIYSQHPSEREEKTQELHDVSLCLSLFFRRSLQLQACSAQLSVQSIRIWMMKPLTQMAWPVGTYHLNGITIPFAKADHFRPSSV